MGQEPLSHPVSLHCADLTSAAVKLPGCAGEGAGNLFRGASQTGASEVAEAAFGGAGSRETLAGGVEATCTQDAASPSSRVSGSERSPCLPSLCEHCMFTWAVDC